MFKDDKGSRECLFLNYIPQYLLGDNQDANSSYEDYPDVAGVDKEIVDANANQEEDSVTEEIPKPVFPCGTCKKVTLLRLLLFSIAELI